MTTDTNPESVKPAMTSAAEPVKGIAEADLRYIAKLLDWCAGEGFCSIPGLDKDPDDFAFDLWGRLAPSGASYTPDSFADALALAATPAQADAVLTAAVNQNDAMRQELAHIGNLVSDLARAMKVDQANEDGSWPDLPDRIQKLIEAAQADAGALVEAATPELFTVSVKQMATMLRTGAEHQRPRAKDFDKVNFEADAALIVYAIKTVAARSRPSTAIDVAGEEK